MKHHALENGGKTGHPPGLLQDDCRKLSKWLASRMNARQEVREVRKLITQEKNREHDHYYPGKVRAWGRK